MKESVSGFEVQGDWGDIVEHGERITQALRDADVRERSDDGERFDDAFEEWNEWRPKAHEALEDEIDEKTAEQASVERGAGERAGNEPDEDLRIAGEKLSASYDALDDDTDDAAEMVDDSLDHAARAADSAGRKALRTVEETVYQHVMTQLTPYYFDNELISANIRQSVRDADDEFTFEVNVNDDRLKAEVSEHLARYDDEIDRWHVETAKETEVAEAAEGVEAPSEAADRSRSTAN